MRSNLQDAGSRYVIRATPEGVAGRWTHPLLVQAGEVGCTDMNDAQFERAVHEQSNLLIRRAAIARQRRFCGSPLTGFGSI